MSGTGDSERRNDDAEQAARAAWQDIVDNFGERAELDDLDPTPTAPTRPAPEPEPVAVDIRAAYDEAERFVPPPPPPLPRPEPRRAVAWAGLFGVPVLTLLLLIVRIDLPALLDYLLIAWFVGGFGYLVATMSQTPRDPWDDGSRI